MKLYVKEPGSRKLARWFGPRIAGVKPALPLYTSWLGYPKARSAATRKRNIGTLPASAVFGVWHRIVADFASPSPLYGIVKPTDAVVIRSAMLVVQHGLRAYDAVHLASALALQNDLRGASPVTFISSDLRLKRATVAERLPVLDPMV